jgi:hypothetical protein
MQAFAAGCVLTYVTVFKLQLVIYMASARTEQKSPLPRNLLLLYAYPLLLYLFI